MSGGALLLFLLAAAAFGGLGWLISFRQATFRSMLRTIRGRERRERSADTEEAALYANRIFGTMVMSFGLIVAVFAVGFFLAFN